MITGAVYRRIWIGCVVRNVYCYVVILAVRGELQNHRIDYNQTDTSRIHLLDRCGRSQPHLNCGRVWVTVFLNISGGNIFILSYYVRHYSVTVQCLFPNMDVYYTKYGSFKVLFIDWYYPYRHRYGCFTNRFWMVLFCDAFVCSSWTYYYEEVGGRWVTKKTWFLENSLLNNCY